MKEVKVHRYKGNDIYFYENYYLKIAKKIIDKEYEELVKIKDSKRNYVSLMKIDDTKYLYKEPRNEYRIPQRQVMTFFKKGEVLSTLENITNLIDKEGFIDYVRPYLAIVKRKKRLIIFSSILFEYIHNKGDSEEEDYDNILEKIRLLHLKGYYHGDFNPSNFIKENNGNIRILDTQGKKMLFGNYRAHYDMLTMKMDSYQDMIYPYKKNIFYYFAFFVKKFKRLKWIEKIKKKKKELRDKGWKI